MHVLDFFPFLVPALRGVKISEIFRSRNFRKFAYIGKLFSNGCNFAISWPIWLRFWYVVEKIEIYKRGGTTFFDFEPEIGVFLAGSQSYDFFEKKLVKKKIYKNFFWGGRKFFSPETPVKHVLSTLHGGLGEKFAFKVFFCLFPAHAE